MPSDFERAVFTALLFCPEKTKNNAFLIKNSHIYLHFQAFYDIIKVYKSGTSAM